MGIKALSPHGHYDLGWEKTVQHWRTAQKTGNFGADSGTHRAYSAGKKSEFVRAFRIAKGWALVQCQCDCFWLCSWKFLDLRQGTVSPSPADRSMGWNCRSLFIEELRSNLNPYSQEKKSSSQWWGISSTTGSNMWFLIVVYQPDFSTE